MLAVTFYMVTFINYSKFDVKITVTIPGWLVVTKSLMKSIPVSVELYLYLSLWPSNINNREKNHCDCFITFKKENITTSYFFWSSKESSTLVMCWTLFFNKDIPALSTQTSPAIWSIIPYSSWETNWFILEKQRLGLMH